MEEVLSVCHNLHLHILGGQSWEEQMPWQSEEDFLDQILE